MRKLLIENNHEGSFHKNNQIDIFFKIGTIAGNLSLKHDHHEFPSDIFLLLETISTKLIIGTLNVYFLYNVTPVSIILVEENGNTVEKTVKDFINFDMNHCVLKSIIIYPLKKDTHLFESYKVSTNNYFTNVLQLFLRII